MMRFISKEIMHSCKEIMVKLTEHDIQIRTSNYLSFGCVDRTELDTLWEVEPQETIHDATVCMMDAIDKWCADNGIDFTMERYFLEGE